MASANPLSSSGAGITPHRGTGHAASFVPLHPPDPVLDDPPPTPRACNLPDPPFREGRGAGVLKCPQAAFQGWGWGNECLGPQQRGLCPLQGVVPTVPKQYHCELVKHTLKIWKNVENVLLLLLPVLINFIMVPGLSSRPLNCKVPTSLKLTQKAFFQNCG